MRHGDVEGTFEAALDLSFSFLLGLGFEPVHPTHPSYPAYLSAVREPTPPLEPAAAAFDPHDPDLIVMPFETVVSVSDDVGLRFGLVPPGHAATRAPAAPHGRPMRCKSIPPPWHGRQHRAGATDPMPEISDFALFMRALDEPDEQATDVNKHPQVPHPIGETDLPIQAGEDVLSEVTGEAPPLQFAVERRVVATTAGSGPNAAGPALSGPLIPVQAPLVAALDAAVSGLATAKTIRLLTELRQQVQSDTSKAREAIASEIAAIDEELRALEYRGQLRHNTLALLSQAVPTLK